MISDSDSKASSLGLIVMRCDMYLCFLMDSIRQ